MTREEQIKQYCADQGYPYGACSGVSSVKAIVATEAIKWADQHPKYFRGQSDEMMEHESLFVDDWYKEHKGERPTYADAIAWAEKTMLDKFERFLAKNNKGQLIGRLKRFLEE